MTALTVPSPAPHRFTGETDHTQTACTQCGLSRQAPVHIQDPRLGEATDLTEEDVEQAIGPLEDWRYSCHAASLALVRSGLLPENWRVARGYSVGIHGQHSWCVDGDPYDATSRVLDVTAWCYYPRPRVWHATNLVAHIPHGWGEPPPGVTVELRGDPYSLDGLTPEAEAYLADRYPDGYSVQNLASLVSGPIQGWPAADVMRALAFAGLGGLIPVDSAAMVLEGGYR